MSMLMAGPVLAGCASGSKWRPAGAETNPAEEAAVLAAVEEALDAMGRRDKERYAAVLTADGMTYSQRLANGEWRLRRRSNAEDIELPDDATEPMEETLWSPTVLICGPMAVVWVPYEFRIGGSLSHCGVDVFEMLRIEGRRVMGNAMWTVEPQGCEELRALANSP